MKLSERKIDFNVYTKEAGEWLKSRKEKEFEALDKKLNKLELTGKSCGEGISVNSISPESFPKSSLNRNN